MDIVKTRLFHSYEYAYRQLVSGWVFRNDWEQECQVLKHELYALGITPPQIEYHEKRIAKECQHQWIEIS